MEQLHLQHWETITAGFLLGIRTGNRQHWPDPEVDISLKVIPLLSHTAGLTPCPKDSTTSQKQLESKSDGDGYLQPNCSI